MTVPVTTSPDPTAVQTRTALTLMGSQRLGGIGVAANIAVGSIVAADVSASVRLVRHDQQLTAVIPGRDHP